jgi:uncharacterized protein YjaZ
METYVEKHLDEICATHDGQAWVQKQHKSSFTAWFQEQDIPHGETDEAEIVTRLASGPSTQITTWQGYYINGYRFHTKKKDKKSIAQNSGVRYEGIDDSMGKRRQYYGQVEEI